jgi:chemotaxis protein MotA
MSEPMLALVGIALVFLAVFGGYLLEHGNPWVLVQPAELLIIGGSAAGIVIVSNPPHVIASMARGVVSTFRPPFANRNAYLRLLRMLFEIFAYSQRTRGMGGIEADVEEPEQSKIFSKYPEFLGNRFLRDFVCDSLRMLVIGNTAPHELDALMDLDIDVQRRGQHEPVKSLSAVADALPGLGIVAAVLGVVITMEAIGGAPETIGQKVAAALVGTFLGILLCYGVVGPFAARLEHLSEVESQFFQVLRTAIVAFARGAAPILAVEYARRSIPVELRPAFAEFENSIRREAQVPAAPGADASGAGTSPAREGHAA